nr:MAG TPA: hypothetical protein [Caudoviricetes sp.]
MHSYLQKHLKNSLLNFVDGKNMNDGLVEQQLRRIIEDINNNFISEYEIAA